MIGYCQCRKVFVCWPGTNKIYRSSSGTGSSLQNVVFQYTRTERAGLCKNQFFPSLITTAQDAKTAHAGFLNNSWKNIEKIRFSVICFVDHIFGAVLLTPILHQQHTLLNLPAQSFSPLLIHILGSSILIPHFACFSWWWFTWCYFVQSCFILHFNSNPNYFRFPLSS